MKNNIAIFTIASLLAAVLVSGCEELYAVKAMRQKQAEVRHGNPASMNDGATPEEREDYSKSYTSSGRYKDKFLYEKEAPLKPEKELKDEPVVKGQPAPQVKPETALASSGPNEMQRLREMRDAEEKQAVAKGKPATKKIERSDVGLTDPINVPKQLNAEKLTPPEELLKPINIDDSEKTEASAVPSRPKEVKPSTDEKVNAELKKLATKIESKPSPVLPKEEPAAPAAPAAAAKVEPKPAPAPAVAAAPADKTPVPATGFDWNKLSAAKPAATAETPKPAEPAKSEIQPLPSIAAAPNPEPAKVEPATPAAEVKPAPVVEAPKPVPTVAVKTPEPVTPVVEAPKPAPTATAQLAPATKVEAPKETPVAAAAEPVKKPVPMTEARKEEAPASESSWETEFVTEKTPTAKVETAKAEPKTEPKAPAPAEKKNDNMGWDLPKNETAKEPATETPVAAAEPKAEEPATVEIKLANSTVPESTFIAPKPKPAQAPLPTPTVKPAPVTPAAAETPKVEAPKAPAPVAVAVATPKPAAPAMTDDEAATAETKRKVEVMTKQVQILTKEKNYSEALKVLDKILAIDSENLWAQDQKNLIGRLSKPAIAPAPAVKPAPVAAIAPKPEPAVVATPKPAPASVVVATPKPAPVVVAPKPAPAPVVKPAPKKPVVEPVVGTNADRTFKGWPGSGMILKSGMERLLSWLPDNASQFTNLRLMFSSNGGKDWTTVASDLKAGGVASWAVPVVTSDNCRLKIVGADSSGEDVTLAISEQFSVNTGVWETVESTAVK